MQEEIKAQNNNHTWSVVPIKNKMKVIGNKWVYKINKNADASIAKYKDRLVAKVFDQSYGIDSKETSSLVAKMSSPRTALIKEDLPAPVTIERNDDNWLWMGTTHVCHRFK